jgi:hypothetical protein
LFNGDGVVQQIRIRMVAKENVCVPVYHQYLYDEHGVEGVE